MKNFSKYVLIILSLVFLSQAFSLFQIIDVYYVLEKIGLADNILDIVMGLVYLVGALIVSTLILTSLNKRGVVKGVTKNTIILRIVVGYVKFFLVFFPAWIIFGTFLNGEHGINLSNQDINLESFLNTYLFCYLLITAFFRPKVDPEFGIKKNNQDGLV
jgi:hypothetical protein